MSNLNDFSIKDGVLICYNGDDSDVVIPEDVISISDFAFRNNRTLTSVVIPNSVTKIGRDAFRKCESLKNVVIPNGVTRIGVGAFDSCKSLTNVVIPNSVTNIGDDAFIECESLKNVVIPNSVTRIGRYAFYRCKSLTEVVIPDSVTCIDTAAFQFCESLTKVVIPNSVTRIGSSAFYSCKSLTEVVIPDSVTSIEDGAFEYCESLTSIEIPDSVTGIGESAFKGCKSLKGIEIPDSVKTIGIGAFSECDSLVDDNGMFFYKNRLLTFCSNEEQPYIVIPDGTTYIDSYIFSMSFKFRIINLEMSIKCPEWDLDGAAMVHGYAKSLLRFSGSTITFRDKDGKKVALVVLAYDDETEPKENGAILSIKSLNGEFDFAGYDEYFAKLSKARNKVRIALARLEYPYKLSDEMLGVYQSYLKRNSFEAGTVLIDEDRIEFLNVLGDRKLITASAIDKLIEYSQKKENIEITSYLMNYKNTVFGGRKTSKSKSNLDDFVLEDTPVVDKGMSLAEWRKIFKFKYIDGNIKITGYKGNEECIEIPERIGDKYVVGIAFNFINVHSKTTKKIVVPGTVKKIDSGAFYVVERLEIEVKEGTTEIARDAFFAVRDLVIKLPQTLNKMEEQFGDSLQETVSLIVPEGSYAESVCKKYNYNYTTVETVKVEELRIPVVENNEANKKTDKKVKPWKKPKAGIHLISRYQGDETAVEFPLEVEGVSIKGVANTAGEAPSNYKNIKSIVIPEGYEVIGKNAFSGCENLVSITLPSTLKQIDSGAFKGCKSLKNIVFPDEVTSFGSGMFSGCEFETVELPAKLSSIPYHCFDGATVNVLIYRGSELSCSGRVFDWGKEPNTIYTDGKISIYNITKKLIKPLKELECSDFAKKT